MRERGTFHFWVELRHLMGCGVMRVLWRKVFQVNLCIGLWQGSLPGGTHQSKA